MTCNNASCTQPATTTITFTDNAKRHYCTSCAQQIGGNQHPITP